MAEFVNVDNFRAAETARLFDDALKVSGGVNQWFHYRAPTGVDNQPVIRMNRDTLYSAAIVDISNGASVTLPDAGDRYMTVMVVNAEHYINRVFSGPGTYELTVDEHETPVALHSAFKRRYRSGTPNLYRDDNTREDHHLSQ